MSAEAISTQEWKAERSWNAIQRQEEKRQKQPHSKPKSGERCTIETNVLSCASLKSPVELREFLTKEFKT